MRPLTSPIIASGQSVSSCASAESSDLRPLTLIVDDSITMRRVTQRLLEKNDMRVLTARDGIDALSVLESHRPATDWRW